MKLHDGGDARKILVQLIVKSWEMSDKELMNAKQRAAACQCLPYKPNIDYKEAWFWLWVALPRSIQISRQKSV